jgi:predicted flavoprotein YhiN
MAAETVAGSGAEVIVYEAMQSVGRKFLLAGRGVLTWLQEADAPAEQDQNNS